MNSEKPDNARDEIDSWQELAKDLLGIELSEELTDDVILPDEDVELLGFELEDESTSATDTRADSPDGTVLSDNEPEPAVSDHEEPTSELADKSEPLEEAELSGIVSDGQKADDPYWDALEDWTWEDEDRPQSAVAGDVPKTIEAPDDTEPSASVTTQPVRSRSDTYLDDPSFGIGVLDDDSPTPSPQTDVTTEATDAVTESVREPSEAAVAHRSAEKADVLAPASDEAETSDEAVENVSDGANAAEAADTAETSAVPSGGKRRRRRRRRKPRASDKEGNSKTSEEADVETLAESVSEQTEVPPKKRVRRRRRPRSKEAPQPDTPAAEELSDTAESTAATSSKPADTIPPASRPPAKYRDVPTWEEAISYLLEPSRVGVSSPKKSTSVSDS